LTTGEIDTTEIDEYYDTFRGFTQIMTPHDAVKKLRLFRADEEIIRAVLARHEEESLRIRELDEPPSVYLHNRITWYTGPEKGDRYWPALENSLRKKGFGDDNVASIDEASTKVVALLNHPKEEKFTTKGLVVGFVQSGKTTNFTAVMAKAADRGYKLFIVLSGIHNALRRQTQIRLISDLVDANPTQWHQVTNERHDFIPPDNPKAFFAANEQKVLLVVKKNAAVLRKLRNWLASAGEHLDKCPTLIVDDEADQSTVATIKIRPLLHDVLDKFPRAAYVGYTATPFANLLIDPTSERDFYPRDFIVNLPQPTGYQGTEALFGRELADWEDPEDLPGGYDMVRTVPDEEVEYLKPASKKEAVGFQPEVTPSLGRAIQWFWMATAARRVRGAGSKHSTMLIHTTMETFVHEAFREPILALRSSTLRDIAGGGSSMQRLRTTWNTELARVPSEEFGEEPVTFDELLVHLVPVLRESKIVIDNYRSRDRLDYDSGPVVAIAIGGNTLSRGLTLEGLVSSFFVRAASAYDSLLQMGRWFGYRGGYADLPRIWMTAESAEWFRHLATVEAEMRRDIDRYMTEDVTPTTFAVRLRSHPKLAITAKAKMKHAVKASAAYGGTLVESRYFAVDPEAGPWLRANETAGRELVADAARVGQRAESPDQTVLYIGVPHRHVLDFLNDYSFHERSGDGDRRRLVNYIEKRTRTGALKRWNVGVVGNSRGETDPYDFGSGVKVRAVRRARMMAPDDDRAFDGVADIHTLTSRRDEKLDLVDPDGSHTSRHDILALRQKQRPGEGLLLLYPIDRMSRTPSANRKPLEAPAEIVMGVALVFPQPRGDDDVVEYEYYSADLPPVEQEDAEVLEQDDDE
jgi:hypothetical protein